MKVYVIGAGPMGLIVAYHLSRMGVSVTVFEKSNAVGGLARSFDWNGRTLDVGPHIFHTKNDSLASVWREQFGDILKEGNFYSANIKGDLLDQLIPYPLSKEALKFLDDETAQKVGYEIENLNERHKKSAKTYLEYIEASVGKTLSDLFFKKYPQKLWGIPAEELTADWAPKRVPFREKIEPFFSGEFCAISTKGAGEIYSRVASWILDKGGEIRLETSVAGFSREAGNIESLELDNGEVVKLGKDDMVISTLPITITARMLQIDVDLCFRGVRLCFVLISGTHVIPGDYSWLYCDSDKISITRISEPGKMLGETAISNTVLVLEVPYSHGDETDRLPDKIFEMKTIRELELLGCLPKLEVLDSLSLKEPFVYPVQDRDYRGKLARVLSSIQQYKNLYSVGLGGAFNYTDTQVLFSAAEDLARHLVDTNKPLYADQQRGARQWDFLPEFDLGSSRIGGTNTPFVIAEVGINHNGDIEIAKTLIREAKAAGCNAVKIQSFIPGGRVSGSSRSANYAEEADGLQEPLHKLFERTSIDREFHEELFAFAREQEITIFSTPFDFESVELLENLDCPFYKTASVDLVNIPLLRLIGQTKKPVIVSTGMANLGDVELALGALIKGGSNRIALLHCNSTYPAPSTEMNLSAMRTLGRAFKVPVGLSDHTPGLLCSQIAISMGAHLIERHFTLSRHMVGPDHILSSEPDEMRTLVRSVPEIIGMLGDGIKRPMPSEFTTMFQQRKSIHTARTIKRGEVISKTSIIVKGPGTGIHPKEFDMVVGGIARKNLMPDQPILWSDIFAKV